MSRIVALPALLLVLLAFACGPSEEEIDQRVAAAVADAEAALNVQVAERDTLLAEANVEAGRRDEAMASLGAELSGANETIEDLVRANSEWEQEYEALTVAHDSLSATHDALAQQKTELEGTLATTARELTAVRESLDKAQTNLNILRGAAGRANTLEGRAAEIEGRIAELQEQHRSLTTEYQNLRNAYASLLREQCALRSDKSPYQGTVHDISYNLLGPSDPTSLESVSYIGRGDRSVFDRRPGEWITINAYLFSVSYGDVVLEFQVNPEFGSREAARAQVDNYAAALGRIPAILLSRAEEVHINDGPGGMGGNWNDKSFLIHAERGESYMRRGGLEEVFIHEGVHVSIDNAHENSQGWIEAQMKDCVFISTYARDNPFREDVAESFLPWFALRYLPDRLTASDRAAIMNAIPHRIAYFDEQEFDLSLSG